MLSGKLYLYEEPKPYVAPPPDPKYSGYGMPFLEAEKLVKAAIDVAEACGLVPGVVVKIKASGRLGVIKELYDKPFMTLGYGAKEPRIFKVQYMDLSGATSFFSLADLDDASQAELSQVASNDE